MDLSKFSHNKKNKLSNITLLKVIQDVTGIQLFKKNKFNIIIYGQYNFVH